MKIALGQFDVKAGRVRKNLETMLKMVDKAESEGCDAVVFPELCVDGYLVGDKRNESSWNRNAMAVNEILRERSESGIAIIYGNVYVDESDAINERWGETNWHPNKDGRERKYNAVYGFQHGEVLERVRENGILPLGVQPKTLLPNYRFFDDERYFFSLEDVAKDAGVELEELCQPYLVDVDG